VLAGVLLAEDDLVLAETTIRACLDEARERDASFEIARALDVLADIEARTGRTEDAATHRAEARAQLHALGVLDVEPAPTA
jgi:hypothetical protein